jgi:hypothetical protein
MLFDYFIIINEYFLLMIKNYFNSINLQLIIKLKNLLFIKILDFGLINSSYYY